MGTSCIKLYINRHTHNAETLSALSSHINQLRLNSVVDAWDRFKHHWLTKHEISYDAA